MATMRYFVGGEFFITYNNNNNNNTMARVPRGVKWYYFNPKGNNCDGISIATIARVHKCNAMYPIKTIIYLSNILP